MATKLVMLYLLLAAALSGCAGRPPQPIAAVQPQDAMLNCSAIQAELASNYQRAVTLNGEQHAKQTQNIVAGTVGLLLFWPALFAMDLQGAADQDAASVQSRQAYLGGLQAQRCQPQYQYAGGRGYL